MANLFFSSTFSKRKAVIFINRNPTGPFTRIYEKVSAPCKQIRLPLLPLTPFACTLWNRC